MNLQSWPDKPLVMPHTLVRPSEPYLYDLEGDEWGLVLAGQPFWVGRIAAENYRDEWLEPEVYLHELMDLDATSGESVLAFVGKFGPLRVTDIGQPWGAGALWWGRRAWEQVTETQKVSLDHAAKLGQKPGLVVSSPEFGAVVGTLRDAARTLWAMQGVIDEDELVERWEGPREIFVGSSYLEAATLRTLDTLNAGLTPFSPRIYRGNAGPTDAIHTSLYNVLCLEMFNDHVLGSTYRTCQKCGRIFVRQRGRSQFGENKRKGRVIYCTQKCQNAAQQAKYRQRQAAEKGRGK